MSVGLVTIHEKGENGEQMPSSPEVDFIFGVMNPDGRLIWDTLRHQRLLQFEMVHPSINKHVEEKLLCHVSPLKVFTPLSEGNDGTYLSTLPWQRYS